MAWRHIDIDIDGGTDDEVEELLDKVFDLVVEWDSTHEDAVVYGSANLNAEKPDWAVKDDEPNT